MSREDLFLISRDASSVAQTKQATGPPVFPGRATASRDQRFSRITRHESRNTAFMLFTNHGLYRCPNHSACRRVAVSLFTTVHDCSRLFGIVQQKILFLSQCPSPRRSLWRLPPPAPATRPLGFSRNTKHETRITAFFRITAFLPCRQTGDARRRAGSQDSRGDVRSEGNEWKGVYLNPETGITTYTESGFGSRFGIPHYSSVFVGKIRISPCRQSGASEHCGNRNLDLMDVSSRRITSLGPQVSPSGEAKGERATNRETQPLTRREEQAGPNSEVFTKHETRITKHGFFPTRSSKQGLLVLKPFSLFFLSGDGLG